jgi:hypothetical protein
MTTETLFLIDKHDAVFRPFLDGTPRTDCLTGRIPTVHAGKRNASARDVGKWSFPNTHDLSPPHTIFKLVYGLAGHLTRVALDTSLGIKIKAIL